MDFTIGKSTTITERFKLQYSFDFFNMFNHVNFLNPSFNVNTPASFGVISTQLVPADRNAGSRWIQFGLRLEF